MKLAVFFIAAAAAAQVPSCTVVSGWTQKGPARTFNSETLFEYMDGNSEGYLIYGFNGMKGVTCQRGEDTLVIDLSEMDNPDAAYGLYTATRDPNTPDEKIGMAGQVMPRKAIFVKDRYYLEISANPEKDHSAALRAFVTAFEKQMTGRTSLPEALSLFPQEKRTSLRLVPESVLGIRLLKRGYAAEYEFAKAFLVSEQSPQSAAAVMEKLRARFAGSENAQVGDEAFRAEDRYLGKLCFFRKGAMLGGYAAVKAGDPVVLATALAARVK